MSKAYFKINRPGINSTFQDLGRLNLHHIGIPLSGVMDKRNYLIGNKLVENSNDINERKQMMLGSGIAGKAIHYTGCGICHCIAHTLGSLTKVPHGVAVAYGLLHTIEPVLRLTFFRSFASFVFP